MSVFVWLFVRLRAHLLDDSLDFIESDRIPQIFRDIHSWRLDELLFGKTTFDVEDVIASLHPVYADLREFPEFSPDPETPARVVIQKMVLRKNEMNKAEGALVNVIRSLGKDNQDFLATFVLYVTGYDYLPVAVPIHIEFNHYESGSNVHLPVAHTW